MYVHTRNDQGVHGCALVPAFLSPNKANYRKRTGGKTTGKNTPAPSTHLGPEQSLKPLISCSWMELNSALDKKRQFPDVLPDSLLHLLHAQHLGETYYKAPALMY